MLSSDRKVDIAMDEQLVRRQLGEALGTVRPLVTMSRDGFVITALEWATPQAPDYETATAATRTGDLELREQAKKTGAVVAPVAGVLRRRHRPAPAASCARATAS
jgi:hypothetical protein